MKTLKKIVVGLFALLSLAGGPVLAESEAPDVLIKRISQEILDLAKTDKKIQAGDQQRIMEVVEDKIIPHVDFQRMTTLAAGRYWREATPDQQAELVSEFRTLLIYTYSGAIAQLRNEKLDFKPMRGDPKADDVEVRTVVLQSRGEAIQLNYRLEKTPAGWKIYDVNILGAWLIQTYRGSFAAEIGKGGIDGLIKTLAERNKRLAASPPKPVKS
jgi:phospholipid transport system substrate-binding protein